MNVTFKLDLTMGKTSQWKPSTTAIKGTNQCLQEATVDTRVACISL